MATTAAVIAAERWLDEVILRCNLPADVAGAALSENISLPAGLGDVAIMSLTVRFTSVDVGPAAASSVPRGVRSMVLSADASTVLDVVGTAPVYLTYDVATTLQYQAFIDPDALVLWRQSELVDVAGPEMDSDATPTGDVIVWIKCVRVRPIEAPIGPVQLVR